jgi:hypothetical protein
MTERSKFLKIAKFSNLIFNTTQIQIPSIASAIDLSCTMQNYRVCFNSFGKKAVVRIKEISLKSACFNFETELELFFIISPSDKTN